MAFKVSKTPKRIEAEFQYIKTDAGIEEADGIKLYFRSHTIDEILKFQERLSDALTVTAPRNVGRGFRDRSKDPRAQDVKYHTDAEKTFEVHKDQIRTSLFDWEGFVDEDTGESLPYSFEAFMRACEHLPDLFVFAIQDCVDVINDRGNKQIRDAEKNSPSGPTID